jgi:phenol hydroxylase P0 protein
MGAQANRTNAGFDAKRRYVRVCNERVDGFVEFEFAIGDPALCVELILPRAAFQDFCRVNDVITLDPAAGAGDDWVARLNSASHRDIDEAR